MRTRRIPVIAMGCLFCVAATAQPRAIDAGKSVMTVRVYKAGLLSGLGHDHVISAPIANGTVDTGSHRVELHVKADSLKVNDQGISDKDRGEIQSNMVGAPVLDAARFPEIVFRAEDASSGASGAWTVNGSLTLHGQTRPVTVNVRESAGHFTGVSRLRQSDFGITPIKIAGGAVRVKDEIQIEFDIQLSR